MIRKKLAFFAEEALKRVTDTMWGLSDIKKIELLQKIPRYLEHLLHFLLSNSTNAFLFTFPFCCLSCKKQIEKRQRLVVNVITMENDLRSRQFLEENFFRIAARSISSLDKRILVAFSKWSYGVSEEECTTTNMISVIRIYLLCLQTVLITAAPGVTI